MKKVNWIMAAKAAAGVALVSTMIGAGVARADFPERFVRIVVPFPPGGSAEMQARLLGDQLAKEWSQPVVIENKPGAGTVIGASFVAESPPDGYTLYLAGTSHTISASLYDNIKYDAVASFSPITMVSTSPFILVVNEKSAFHNVKELIEAARAKPGSIDYGTSGTGAGPHLSGELFKDMTGIEVEHVPYKGSAPAVQAVVGGHVDYAMADIAAVPLIKAGRLRALAVTSATRSDLLPDVPTMAEAGLQGYEVTNWSALLAPKDTPDDVVRFLNTAATRALSDPQVKAAYHQQGFQTSPSSPQALKEHLNGEVEKYRRIIKQANIRVQ